MKFLRRLPRLEWVVALFIVGSGALFSGCATNYDSQFSDIPQRPVSGAGTASSTNTANISAHLGSREDVFNVGDFVTVSFSGVQTPPLPHEEQVKGDGDVTLPLVGSVRADGRTPGELQKELYALYVPKYYTASSGFTVTVKPKERVYFVGGEVKMAGPKVYLGMTTVTKAIQTAGDFTDFAKKTKVKLTRSNGTTITVNCKKALENPELDPPVFPGDKIHVPRRFF